MQIILLSAMSCGMRDIHTSISLNHHSIVLIYIQSTQYFILVQFAARCLLLIVTSQVPI